MFPIKIGDLFRPGTFYEACGLVLGALLALCPAMAVQFFYGLWRAISNITCGFSPYERYARHYFYNWFVYICPSLHKLHKDANPGHPYMCQLVAENSRRQTSTLILAAIRRFLWDARSYVIFHLLSLATRQHHFL